MSDLDLDAIMATYEENRARAHAWRVADQIPVLVTEVRRLSALCATCTCGHSYETFEGPEPDCPVHGAVRALNEILGRPGRADALSDLEHVATLALSTLPEADRPAGVAQFRRDLQALGVSPEELDRAGITDD
jgi:hypothetical protein